MGQRDMRNKKRPEIIVVDPRKTETAMAATQHIALKPKSDLALLYGLANVLVANGWIERDYIVRHTAGFEAFAEFVAPFTPAVTSAATGLSAGQIGQFADAIHRGRRVSFWGTMGVNHGHEATPTAHANIHLAVRTANTGHPVTR